MNTQIKMIAIKLVSILFLIAGFLLISESNVHARFMKKIIIEPILSPIDWQKPFDPGTVFTLMLGNSLAKSGQVQMIQPPKKITKKDLSNLIKNSKIDEDEILEVTKEKINDRVDLSKETTSFKSPLGQYQIRGRILIFNPDTNPVKKGHLKKGVFSHKERAKVKAVIELTNLRTGRSLAKKSFTFISNEGRTAFNPKMTTPDYDGLEFKSSSVGKAFGKLNNSVKVFIIQLLSNVPLEGDLILVDHKTKSAIINLGETNGITVQDVFTVLSMKTDFNDPLNQTDLGDKYTRKGVIKITEVQDRFSRAQILAGLDLVPGDLVVPKNRKSTKYKSEDHLSKKNIIWGAYKGLSSLSY